MMKNLFKIGLWLFLLWAITAFTICAQSANAQENVLQKVRERGVFIVGMESNDAPMNFVNEKNQRDGFDYKLALEIAKKMAIPRVEVKEADYEVLPDLLRKGEIDLIMGGYVPDPSIEGVEWSQGYYAFGLCLIVRESSAIKKIKHLKGKTVAIYNDPSAEEWVRENIPEVKIKKYSGDSGWFEAVENGDVDALIYDYPFAATEIKLHPKTKIVEFNLNESTYAIGVAAKNYDLLDEINKALDNIMASPTYQQLVTTYFAYASEEYTKPVRGAQNSYTVQRGDTLSIIARKQLGSPERWKDIWELNKDRIPNPDLIQAGWVLVMP